MDQVEKEEFGRAVYEIVAAIPRGKVASYGEVALLAGYPGYHRLVGRVLRGAEPAMGLPCHRVVTGQGRLVPGWTAQRRLLCGEGVSFKANGNVDMGACAWRPMEAEGLRDV